MKKIPTCKYCGKQGHYAYQCFQKIKDQRQKKKSKPIKVKPQTSSGVKTRPTLIKQLDKVFSYYIRLSYANPVTGICQCYTCGKKQHWKLMDNAHYIKRGKMNTRWLPSNCRVCCKHCNQTLNGNYPEYTRRLKLEIGVDGIQKLYDKASRVDKIPTPTLVNMIEFYQNKVNELKQEKRL